MVVFNDSLVVKNATLSIFLVGFFCIIQKHLWYLHSNVFIFSEFWHKQWSLWFVCKAVPNPGGKWLQNQHPARQSPTHHCQIIPNNKNKFRWTRRSNNSSNQRRVMFLSAVCFALLWKLLFFLWESGKNDRNILFSN